MATAVIGSLVGEGSGKLFDGISHVINSIKGKNPEDAAKLQEIVENNKAHFVDAEVAMDASYRQENVKLNEIAGENVRADADGDKIQRWARPAIIWGGMMILMWNYMLIPFLAIHYASAKPAIFPDMFWEIWGVVATGVVMTRSVDKGVSSLLGGNGGSAQLPFGIKLDSKG